MKSVGIYSDMEGTWYVVDACSTSY